MLTSSLNVTVFLGLAPFFILMSAGEEDPAAAALSFSRSFKSISAKYPLMERFIRLSKRDSKSAPGLCWTRALLLLLILA